MLDVHAGDSLIWSLDEEGRLVVSRGQHRALSDIRIAVAAAGPIHAPKTVTVRKMKAGIMDTMRSKHRS